MALKQYIASLILLSLLFVSLGCSTKKDAFVNRNWHAINAEFNAIYNGQLALEKGIESLKTEYRDNYWELLPVERMQIIEDVRLEGNPINPNFNRAEEKAVKAIQKHGMYIEGKERNPQSDEAYLLLGKARYYDQRFIPALEAFNYILSKYTNSDIINQAKIWREKTNIRLEYEELALKNYKRLLKSVNIKDQDHADVYAMMGQAYINLEQKDSAVQKLKLASYYTKSNEERGRYDFIIGQLYNELGHKDSANIAFEKVIALKRKTPRIYHINAYIERIKNIDVTTENREELLELLTELEENRENRPFLDRIYHQKAMFFNNEDSTALAEVYFNKSLRTDSPDKILNSINYELLAQMKFDQHKFKAAGAYYDSTLTNLSENTKKYRLLSKKRKNLDDVIKYEGILRYSDSIRYVTSLSETARSEYYQKHIDSLLSLEENKKEKERIKQLQQAQGGGLSNTGRQSFNGSEGTFYFYNTTNVAYGKNEFRKIWGNRALEDNWRLSDKSVSVQEEIVVTEDTIGVAKENDIYKVSYYTDRLPSDPKVLDSLHKEQNFAYYQLGLIYKEKFSEYGLAVNRLNRMLENDPEEKYVLPARYNLYKIYEATDSPLKVQARYDILDQYPDSRYAVFLRNPNAVMEGDRGPDAAYEKLYQKFESQHYNEVLNEIDRYITNFTGEEIVPKLEMLKATTIARLRGVEPYETALNQIALNYPNHKEGIEASELVEKSIPKLKQYELIEDDTTAQNWKIVFPFAKQDTAGIGKLKKTITRSLKELEYDKFYLSEDVYDENQVFVVVHGLMSKDRALGYAELLKINKLYLVEDENFVISSANYKTIQIRKNLDTYLTQIYKPLETP